MIQNSSATLYILCGYPYSGKSYFAKEIVSQTRIELVSIDSIFNSRGFSWDDEVLPTKNEWEDIFNEAYEQTDTALKEGKSVILDSTNHTIESRNKLREMANIKNVECKVIYIKTPLETIWQRLEENNLNPKRFKVSRELVRQTIEAFEEPELDESVIIIEN